MARNRNPRRFVPTAAQVAADLRAAGFKTIRISEPEDEVDGEVAVSETVHVQVGFSHCGVVHDKGDEFEFYPEATSFAALHRDLKTATSLDEQREADACAYENRGLHHLAAIVRGKVGEPL
jgi:hypothetical protein